MSRWPTEASILRSNAFPSGPLNLPQGLDIHSTVAHPTFRPWGSKSANEDIVLLAEFSEIEGPVPLLTIPQLPSLQIDLNEFVVKVLSTDYLNTSGEFRVYEDTQLVQQDLTPGIHVYVHYFTLYDVRARGFVRPMCLSYISADYQKLLYYFSHLKQKFTLATESLKMSNYTWFSKEMEGLIQDLEYTKDRYIQSHRITLDPVSLKSVIQSYMNKDEEMNGKMKLNSQNIDSHDNRSSSVVMDVEVKDALSNIATPIQLCSEDGSHLGISELDKKDDPDLPPVINTVVQEEGEETLLKHTTLESLGTQLMECQHILDVIKPHMNKKDVVEDLQSLYEHIISNPHSPLNKAMKDLDMLGKPEIKTKPIICIMSLMKRNFHDMRSIQQLCGVGYVACLYQLRNIYERFCKPFLTLRFEDLDSEVFKNPLGSLFIGNIPVINIQKNDKSSKFSIQASPYSGLCWDTHFIKYLRNGTSHVSTPDSEYMAASDNPSNIALVSTAGDCLEVFSRTGKQNESLLSQCKELRESLYSWTEGQNQSLLFQDKEQKINSDILVQSREMLNNGKFCVNQDSSGTIQKETKDVTNASEVNGTKEGFSNHHNSSDIRVERRDGSEENRRVLMSQQSVSSISSWTSNPSLCLVDYEDIQEEEGVEEDVSTLAKGEFIPKVDIDNRKVITKVCRLAGLVQQFCGVSHCLVHSLLSGRTVIIAAEEIYKPTVSMYVGALSTLLPRTPTEQLPILRWHTGTVTEHHLQQFKVMGVCIPERLHVQDLMSNTTLNQVTVLNIETGHISGVAYSGSLVRGVEHYGRKLFHSNSALQACLQSIIVSLGLKVYLLHHLFGVTNRTAGEILKGLGVSKGDWDIIMYLEGLIHKQLKMKQENASV